MLELNPDVVFYGASNSCEVLFCLEQNCQHAGGFS